MRSDPSRSWWDKSKRPVLAALSGTLYFVAFPGFDQWFLAWIALVPILWALDGRLLSRRLSNRAVWLVGAIFGLVTNLGGYYWLVGMLERFSGFPVALCLLFAGLLCLYQGGLLAVFAWIYHRATARGWSPLVVAPIAFGASETLYPLLFPSYYANHFHELPLFIQVADMGGPVLVTMAAVAVNASIYEVGRVLCAPGPVALSSSTSRRTVQIGRPLGVGLCVVLVTCAYGWYRIADIDRASRSFPERSVGLVQADLGIFEKRQDPLEGYRRHLNLSLDLEWRSHPDLIVWPESAYTFFLPEDQTNVADRVMGSLSTPLLFGGLARRDSDGGPRHYNTAYLVDRSGDVLGTYDKTFLLAFGEYLPFGETFPQLYEWSPNSGRFTPGSHVRPLEWGPYRITALICYEDIVPEFTRTAVSEGRPHLLVNLTNDAWFGDTSEPWQHLALAKFRAVEHHRYLVRSTNSGVSAVVDPVGRVLDEMGVGKHGVIQSRVRMMEGSTWYGRLGNWPGWLAVLAALYGVLRSRRIEEEDRAV